MTPVMTSTDGRWVASTRWMPTARAIWAIRTTESSTSRAATIIRSLSSSTTTNDEGQPLGSRSQGAPCALVADVPVVPDGLGIEGSPTLHWAPF